MKFRREARRIYWHVLFPLIFGVYGKLGILLSRKEKAKRTCAGFWAEKNHITFRHVHSFFWFFGFFGLFRGGASLCHIF